MYHKLIPIIVGVAAAISVMTAIAVAAPEYRSAIGDAGVPTFGANVTNTVPMTGAQKIAAVIAKTFGVSVAEVLAVRQQDLGWGEVYKVFLLAKLTGQSPAQIVALRQNNQGWGEIYKSLGVRLGKGQNLGQSVKAAQTTNNQPTSPPGKPSNPGDHGKGKNDDKGKGNDKGKGR